MRSCGLHGAWRCGLRAHEILVWYDAASGSRGTDLMVVFVAANAVTQFMEPFSDLIYRYYFPRVKQYRIVGETRFEQESFEGVQGVTDWRQPSDG